MVSGYLEKRARSGWTIVLDFGKDADGKRIRKYQPFKGNKKEAERELARLITEANKETYVDPTTMTTGEYLTWWLEQHSLAKGLAPKTVESYEYLINKHLTPVLG
ncbi:MAG: hypothetical protein GX489_00815 [Firmicutes bacterium]|nr:hypothetical protein [Bacillota bacterium]